MGHQREILYAADVAKIRGTTTRAGRALLAALERKHGSKVVGRDGDKLFITRRNLARFLPGLAESSADADPHFSQLFRQVQAQAHVVFDTVNCTKELREWREIFDARLDAMERRQDAIERLLAGDPMDVSPCVVARLDDGGGSRGGRRRTFAAQWVGGQDRADGRPRAGVPECPPPSSTPSVARTSTSSATLRAAAPRLSVAELTATKDATSPEAQGDAEPAESRASCETSEEELARLVREQRDDQLQDRIGLRRTVLGDCLRGIGVRDDDCAPRGRTRHHEEP
jgi:hypothetical protein